MLTASEIISAPLYNLRNRWNISQWTILIAATTEDFSNVKRIKAANVC